MSSVRRPKWWQRNRHDAKAVEKVLPEQPLADGGLQVAMGRRDDADIHGNALLAPNALNAFLLKNA